MKIIEYERDEYSFKKAMQDNVNTNFAELLKKYGFIKYKKNSFVRERDQLVQIFYFRVEVSRMRVYAQYIPLCYTNDSCLEFGIEVTADGYKFLDGKYFTTVYESNFLDHDIQYKDYYEKHIISLQKLYTLIEEGIIPEMDGINSFIKFGEVLVSNNTCFLKKSILPIRKNGELYQYIINVYKCLHEDYNDGLSALKNLIAYDPNIIKCLEIIVSLSKEEFITGYNSICDQMRKYYKLK